MHQANKWWASNYVAYLAAVSSLAVLLTVTIVSVRTTPINFSLNFNPYSIFSFLGALADLGLVVMILTKKRYSETTNWFLLFIVSATVYAVAEGLQRSSVHPEAALFWQSFSNFGLALLPIAFYLFIVSFSVQYKKQFILLISFLIFTWGVVGFFNGGGLFFSHAVAHIHHEPWGYVSDPTRVDNILLAWFVLFYTLGTGLLWQFRRASQNKLIRRQASIFMIAFLAPFATAVLALVILPSFAPNILPNLSTLVGAFSGIIIYYGMIKYRLFELDPQLLAQNILDTMSEAVIITREDMSIESINHEAERLLGISNEKANNQNIQKYFIDNTWESSLNKINNNQNQSEDQTVTRSEVKSADGKITPVRIAVSNLSDMGQAGVSIIVLSDISEISRSFDALQKSAGHIYEQNDELRKLEKQLEEEKANVEHTVEVRTKELTEAQSRLKAADQLKNEFIMLTSHDLRTPLTIAKSYSEMLSNIPRPANEKALITGLEGGLKKLDDLIEDLLTISTIESGNKLILEEIAFEKIIEPLIKETKDLANVQNDKLIINLNTGDAKVKANIKRLQGAIGNVLNNACKFTKNGVVELSTARLNDKLSISIADNGIGIDPSELPKLFTKFHKAENALSSSNQGQGIGLYISKLIIDEHGGKISVSSQLGKGTTFTIELPCY